VSLVFTVEVTPRAAAQIERAARWWADNRPAAPGAIADDFEAAANLLARQPGVGAMSSSSRYPGLRRLYLSRVRYHVYYRVANDKVLVLAFWHASRGAGPSL
jgi:plasmid stabilization system protein ParE